MASDASIFLIVGGLSILGLVVVLVVLRTAFPTGKPKAGGIMTGPMERHLAATPALPIAEIPSKELHPDPARLRKGEEAAALVPVTSADEVLDNIIRQGWGNARLLRLNEGLVVVRYYECSDCAPGSGVEQQPEQGCGFQAGYLQAAFRQVLKGDAHATETRCRAQGHPACEFQVMFQ